MKKPIVVVNVLYIDSTFSFGRDIGKWIGFWANYMALLFIEASKQLDVHDEAILEFAELED